MLAEIFIKFRMVTNIAILMLLLLSPTRSKAISIVGSTPSLTRDVEVEEVATIGYEGQDIEITSTFFLSLAIDLLTILLVIIFIYYKNYKKLDTIFTFVMFNIIIFLLTYVLNTVKISMGAAFGLFAVFSMLRYRTSSIDLKDMTYLFIFIAMGLISAIEMDLYEIIIISVLIFMFTFLLDSRILFKRESSKLIRFDNTDIIKPEMRNELITELKNRTGLNVHRITISDIDYRRNAANINIYYYE